MNVFLLKTNDSGQQDRYVEYILDRKTHEHKAITHVEQINLLKFNFKNLDLIKSKLFMFFVEKNYEHYLNDYSKCLILTSRQTIESIQEALSEVFINLEKDDSDSEQSTLYLETSLENHQNKLIVYCVGESTASRFKLFIKNLKQINPDLDRHLIIRLVSEPKKSEYKQNACELSKLIAQDYESIKSSLSFTDSFKYALYPCSSIRRDDLSKNLTQSGISYDEINTYDTGPCQKGLDKLFKTISLCQNEASFLVFFSPSGCDAVFLDPKMKTLIQNEPLKFKFVSIGPSTSSKLKCYVDNSLIYELKEPSPQALWDKLKSILNES
ncbi:unnamed protein product [Brachionus calyciflorus]|uniref:Tetrapyrrole biosynthesis uroporphyrinogen III synthase domain-containing protein n=1 Tax=Brachionus calyciflorus TaxID=104777 RepID=A0A813MW53_9BILA|nr:unnamed protein product [Brachionus calyciflorus]